LELASYNPRGITVDDVREVANMINPQARHLKDDLNLEAYSPSIQRLIYESLGVGFDISWECVDEVFWDYAAPGTAMPHAAETLEFLAENDIRTAVISNMGFMSSTLKRRIDRLIPNNRFEFIMTSSEYFVRKPNPLLFRVALTRTGAENAWYVGDNVRCDIEGSYGAGMHPVWIRQENIAAAECPHDAIDDLSGLKDMVLKCLREG